jgi:hypothetical protein
LLLRDSSFELFAASNTLFRAKTFVGGLFAVKLKFGEPKQLPEPAHFQAIDPADTGRR